jgi:hypothetical protein
VSGVPEIAAAVRAPAGGGHTPPEASRVSVSPGSVETADTSAVTLYAVCLSVCLSVWARYCSKGAPSGLIAAVVKTCRTGASGDPSKSFLSSCGSGQF